MDEAFPLFHQGELSPEDLAVLQAFHAMEDWEPGESAAGAAVTQTSSANQPSNAQSQSTALISEDDMLVLFATEADEDIARMRGALRQLEQDEHVDSPAFESLQRTAHKLKGSAGAIGCHAMSTIAQYVEAVIKLIKTEEIIYLTGLIALAHSMRALETTLQSVVSKGHESEAPLQALEEDFKSLNVAIPGRHVPSSGRPHGGDSFGLGGSGRPQGIAPTIPHDGDSFGHGASSLPPPSVRVDKHHLDRLMAHTEQLVEQHTALESIQRQVEAGVAELQNAQARLRHLEALYQPFSPNTASGAQLITPQDDEGPSSSLVERILHEAVQRTGHIHQSRAKLSSPSQPLHLYEDALWDEMEIDRYTETNVLAHILSEAIADVVTASTQLRLALAQLNTLIQQHMAQAAIVRNDTLLLRSAPFSTLTVRLQRAVQMATTPQKREVRFETSGESTEIDQDILEALVNPCLQLVRESVYEGLLVANNTEQHRIGFKAQVMGNEVAIEISSSMPVAGGAFDALRTAIQHVHGSVSVLRNATEGISFRLRFPRSQGIVQGLLVRAAEQSVVVPFSQVQRIDCNKKEPGTGMQELHDLNALLGFSAATAAAQTMRPLLIVQVDTLQAAVQVDEIVGQVELVMKPLAAHLRRTGIAGTAIDGLGNVLPVVDLPELLGTARFQPQSSSSVPGRIMVGAETGLGLRLAGSLKQKPRTILLADDSVYIRQSLRQTLEHAGYTVLEAHDGLEAFEQVLEQDLDLLLLDIEMPNLNGYDLLSIIRANPLLSHLKIVLLTSRSSEKHKQRALELGAHAFLTKPCPQELLLGTVQSILA